MKATLSFDLPKEREEYQLAYNGSTFASAISQFDAWLRAEEKYQSDSYTASQLTVLRNIRHKWIEMVKELEV